jgi:hypothetical protein
MSFFMNNRLIAVSSMQIQDLLACQVQEEIRNGHNNRVTLVKLA